MSVFLLIAYFKRSSSPDLHLYIEGIPPLVAIDAPVGIISIELSYLFIPDLLLRKNPFVE
jgi:hypothetical protein